MLGPLVADRFLNEEKYRNGHIRIINALPGVRIMGLHTPEVKGVAKELAGREDALEIVAGFGKEAGRTRTGESGKPEQELCYEEKTIWGLMLNTLKLPVGERFRLVGRFVPHIDNWAVCDSFCCSAKWVDIPKGLPRKGARPFWKCSREELWDFLVPYFRSDREFEVRFAVIMSMCNLMDPMWLPKIFAMFDALDFNAIRSGYISPKQAKALGRDKVDALRKGIALGEPPYYVRMGVAWFLATALAKFPDETRAYVAVSKLPQDVIRLYVRKARESFRTRDVSPF